MHLSLTLKNWQANHPDHTPQGLIDIHNQSPHLFAPFFQISTKRNLKNFALYFLFPNFAPRCIWQQDDEKIMLCLKIRQQMAGSLSVMIKRPNHQPDYCF
jgi:hypothetical protein